MSAGIPVSVVVVTKNEEERLPTCLEALARFDDVWVVDSNSADQTQEIAKVAGVRVESFTWNGAYPKKRQWCLDHLDLKYDFVFFVDADEIVPDELVGEITALDFERPGYFVPGLYRFGGKILKHGLQNNKLALIDRRRMEFPVVDDLNIEGMGEIEGHYQPVPKVGCEGTVGQLNTPLLHQAYEDEESWRARHMRYARWETGMNTKGAWPKDPVRVRQVLKVVFRALPFRGWTAFLHCYVFKLGVLDGRAGFDFAHSRRAYYQMISDASRTMEKDGEDSKEEFAQP